MKKVIVYCHVARAVMFRGYNCATAAAQNGTVILAKGNQQNKAYLALKFIEGH